MILTCSKPTLLAGSLGTGCHFMVEKKLTKTSGFFFFVTQLENMWLR